MYTTFRLYFIHKKNIINLTIFHVKESIIIKVAFLDRDGTIIKDYPDKTWSHIKEPEFLVNSLDTLKELESQGFQIIIITNQYLINDNIITFEDYTHFTKKFLSILRENHISILDIFYCPHSKNENCNCFKPKPGLIEKALKKYPEIDLKNSFIVGDSICDIQLGAAFNLLTFGINVNDSKLPYIKVNSLYDILSYIKKSSRTTMESVDFFSPF